MKISLAQLEALFWTVRLGSISDAARYLNVTQPTVSLRLRDLNSAIGKLVLVRDGRGVRLTPDGLSIFEHATRIIEEVDEIYLKARPDETSGLVKVGVSEAFALAGLSKMLPVLTEGHPRLRLDLEISTSGALERDLLSGKIDLAIGINLKPEPRLRVMPLGIQEAAWVAGRAANLPQIIRPHDIAHYQILTTPAPSPAFQQTMNWFSARGIEPRRVSLSNSITVIGHLVAAGVGIAILPSRLIETGLGDSDLVVLRCKPALEPSLMFAAYRSNDWRPALNAVVEAAKAVLDELDWLRPIQ